MGLTVNQSDGGGGNYMQVPPGMHLARCYRVVDMGTQPSVWDGKTTLKLKVMLQFEVHSEDADGNPLLTDKGEPLSITKNFTASLNEKAALRGELENWRSRQFTNEELRGFQLKNVLGAWAMLSVVREKGKDGKDYTNISSINPVPANIKRAGLPTPHNQPKVFDLEEPDMEMFETFGSRMKEKLQSTPEWKARFNTAPERKAPAKSNADSGFDDMESDIPF